VVDRDLYDYGFIRHYFKILGLVSDSKKVFFQELKDEYTSRHESNNQLVAKSSQLITVCRIFVPLLFAFSSLLIGRTAVSSYLTFVLQSVLLISLSFAVASIFFSTWAIRIRSYYKPIKPDYFFKGEILDGSMINRISELNDEQFYDNMIATYLDANRYNLQKDAEGKHKIVIAEFLFVIALAIVPVLVAITFFISMK
jgi:glucan phosphoethanolaminetransferase (alkaline phosphatase superfamily)